MKITQEPKEFQPVAIVLESKEEFLAVFWSMLTFDETERFPGSTSEEQSARKNIALLREKLQRVRDNDFLLQ